jgi:hypothetical protein
MAFKYNDYTQSDAVTEALKKLQEQAANKPGEYQSQWQNQLNDTINKILNREKFSYDLNGDALYQQYKNQYVNQGKMAMMDTMGQAQAMTGGYGNSYAQSVGQQAYQSHLQELNNKIPELYQLALNKYQMEGDEMYNQTALMAQQEEKDYGRYRDQLGDWLTERDYLTGRYDSERDYDYGKWADGRDFSYGEYRDKISDEQWKKEFDEAKRQFDKQYSTSKSSSSSSSSKSSGSSSSKSSGSSSSKSSSSYTKNPGFTKAEILSIQKQAGLTQDGIWGPKTAAAYDKGYRPGTVRKDDTPTNYKELSAYLQSVSSGSSKMDLSKDINSALAAGIINQKQAQQLLKAYAPRGYTK